MENFPLVIPALRFLPGRPRTDIFLQGNITLLPISLGLIAMIFVSVASYGCKFIVNEGFNDDDQFGFWNFNGNNDVCLSTRIFDDDDVIDEFIDGPAKFGRALGIFIGLVGFPAVVCLLMSACVELPGFLKTATWIALFVLAFLSVMLNVGFTTEVCESNECKPAAGAILNILGTFLFIGAGVSFMLIKPGGQPCGTSGRKTSEDQVVREKNKATRVEVNIAENADGTQTKTTTTVVTNKDGSRKVTKEVEIIDQTGENSESDNEMSC